MACGLKPEASCAKHRKTPIFETMPTNPGILLETHTILSAHLNRAVKIDCYLPSHVADISQLGLLLINDGQNLEEMGFAHLLDLMSGNRIISPLLCIGIHAGEERKMEYGVAGYPDYAGRGAKASSYTSFIFEELLPFIKSAYPVFTYGQKAFAGFSLGGLTALDIVWSHPTIFNKAGVFSGSFWWRSMDQEKAGYDDDRHRIMHQRIKEGNFHPGSRFFFQCGNKDETMDRNNNGIIDSIDDTLDLMRLLEERGYNRKDDMYYLEMPDGRHDIPTWAAAMPAFLKWGFGVS